MRSAGDLGPVGYLLPYFVVLTVADYLQTRKVKSVIFHPSRIHFIKLTAILQQVWRDKTAMQSWSMSMFHIYNMDANIPSNVFDSNMSVIIVRSLHSETRPARLWTNTKGLLALVEIGPASSNFEVLDRTLTFNSYRVCRSISTSADHRAR